MDAHPGVLGHADGPDRGVAWDPARSLVEIGVLRLGRVDVSVAEDDRRRVSLRDHQQVLHAAYLFLLVVINA